MAQSVGEVITKWIFKTDTAPLEAIEKRLEHIQGKLEFLAAGEVLKAFYELGSKMAEFAESTHKMAEAAGLGVEEFQKLAFAANQSGVSTESMSSAMTKLTRHLYDAKHGSAEANQLFNQVGISGDQIKGFKNAGDAMRVFADRIAHTKDKMDKLALTTKLLGRGAGEMVPFLNKGAEGMSAAAKEAEELGIVISGDKIATLVELKETMGKLWAVVRGFAATIAAGFAPSMRDAINAVLEFYKANKEMITVGIKEYLDTIMYAMGFFYGVMEIVIKKILDWAAAHPRLAKGIVMIVSVLTTLAVVIAGISAAVGVLAPLIEAFSLIFSPWALAIAAVVVVLHDLWVLFNGGSIKDTWIYQMITWVDELLDSLGLVGDLLRITLNPLGALMKGVGWVAEKLGIISSDKKEDDKSATFTEDQIQPKNANVTQNMQNVAQFPNLVPTFGAPMQSQMTPNSVQVQAESTINVNGVHDPRAVAEQIRNVHKEHTDTMARNLHYNLNQSADRPASGQ